MKSYYLLESKPSVTKARMVVWDMFPLNLSQLMNCGGGYGLEHLCFHELIVMVLHGKLVVSNSGVWHSIFFA